MKIEAKEKLLLWAILLFGLLIFPTTTSASGLHYDYCSHPHSSFSITQTGSGWIHTGWPASLDIEDWADVYVPSGTWDVYLDGPSGTDFDAYVYSGCNGNAGSGLKCSTTSYSSYLKKCTFTSTGSTYHLKVKTSSGSGTWEMWLVHACSSHNYSACSDNDRYWYTSCNVKEDKREECGNDLYGSWNYYCSSNDVYRSRSYTDKGCSSDDCFANTSTQYEVYQDCGDSSYGSWSSSSCSGNNVVQTRAVYNKGCSSGSCTSSTTTETRTVQTCSSNETCESGQCKPKCTSNADTSCYSGDIYWYDSCGNRKEKKTDCGETTYGSWGNSICSGNDVVQSRNKYVPYCESSSCKTNTEVETRVADTCDGLFNFCLINSCIACDSHKSYQCADNDVYWFNSCGGKEDMKQECETSSCDNWSGNFCQDESVVRYRTCYDRGCGQNACYSNADIQYDTVETCEYGCGSGECLELPDLSVSPEDIIFEKT